MRLTLRLMLYLLAMAIGALLVANNVYPWLADLGAQYLKRDEGMLMSSGVATILLITPLGLFLRWLQVNRRAREISYVTEAGRISVNLVAIEEALTRAVEGEPEVKKAHVKVFEDRVRRSIIIDAALTMWEVPNVTDRNRFCQRLLRRRFAELMPEQTAVEVNLNVHRLNVRRPDPRPAEATSVAAAPIAATPIAPDLGSSALRKAANGVGTSTDTFAELAIAPNPAQPSEDDLYVGPSYPVMKDDDEEGSQVYFANKPASKGKPSPPSKR